MIIKTVNRTGLYKITTYKLFGIILLYKKVEQGY